MTARIFREHKKLCIALGAILALALLALYLYALFLPGLWHHTSSGQTPFLYRQADGSFAGSDYYASYEMQVTPTDAGADVAFTVNGTTRRYRILQSATDTKVQIFADDKLVFQGDAHPMGDSYYMLTSEIDSAMDVLQITMGAAPNIEDLFPNYTQIYNWAFAGQQDIRGNPAMLVGIFLCAVVLILDIAFPDLFFKIEHGLDVYGGEPSDFYRTSQKVTRVLLGIAIVVFAALAFLIH